MFLNANSIGRGFLVMIYRELLFLVMLLFRDYK